MAATVVWCNKCKTAVWAYDHMRDGQDIRGFLNMSSMPCPKCGAVGNFDGWSGSIEDFDTQPENVYDGWSLLRYVFSINCKDGLWKISPDCKWFSRPEEEMQSDEYPADLTDEISTLVQERYNNNLAIQAARQLWEESQKET